MSLFDLIFDNKKDKSLIPLRMEAIKKIQDGIFRMKINDFNISLGNETEKNSDVIILSTATRENSNLKGFINHSLKKKDTAKNLMSIGFTKVIVVLEGEKLSIESFYLKDCI